jgi:transposase/IS5 family transposase
MVRYKGSEADNGQGFFLTVNLGEQLLPGTFEHMLNEIINTKIDLSAFDKNYKNEKTGATAIPPAALLKLIMYGYKYGHISSRSIYWLNENNITAKALTGDMDIHWTTIAKFVSGNSEKIKELFVLVLACCHELELIGGDDYGYDGLRLPSNASLEMSGTKEQLEKRLEVYRKMAETHISRHKKKDEAEEADEKTKERFDERQKKLNQKIKKLDDFLKTMEPKKGCDGQEIKSNVTDNESAVIYSRKSGTIQGYIGQAASDAKNQVIVGAQVIGAANEAEHLESMLDIVEENIKSSCGDEAWEGKEKAVLGDAIYFSERNLKICEERGVDAVIPDSQERKRYNEKGEKRYEAKDFIHHEEENELECPQGKRLKHKGSSTKKGKEVETFSAKVSDCRQCPDVSRCSQSKKPPEELTHGKRVIISESNKKDSCSNKARKKMATEEYKEKYSKRIGIIEPVFANIAYCKGMNRFTLRGKEKVNTQWLLYCIVHNLGKILNALNEGKELA